jgi:ubiquinone/menaquinone biosynthesis C-methylase UbiE
LAIEQRKTVSIEHEERHQHAGKSSQAFLKPEDIIDPIGLQKGDKVLDVGCGNGYVSLYAASFVGDDGIVYGVDSDQMAIDALNEVIETRDLKNTVALREDVTEGLALNPNSIDVCLMVNVFHGFVMNGELGDVFRTVNQVLRDQSRLIIVDFKKGEETPGPPQEIRIAISEATQIMLRYGFEYQKTYSPGPYHYGLVFVKSTK